MMSKRPWLTLAFLVLLTCVSVPAQTDTIVRARTLVEDYRLISETIDSVERMRSLISLDSLSPFWAAKVSRQLVVFRNHRDTLRVYLKKTDKLDRRDKTYFKTVTRMEPSSFVYTGEIWTGSGVPFANARDTLMEFANHPEIQAKFLVALQSDTAMNRLIRPLTEIHQIQLGAGIARNEEKIRRYQIKYGPSSARLNVLETVLNYWALQAVPGIRSTSEGPGHFEVIAAYNTAYLILYQTGLGDFPSTPALTSVFEGGLRYYVFKPGWGQAGIVDRILKPAYLTFGGLFGDRSDGFLRLPVHQGNRWGLFGSWGDLKFAFLGLNDMDHSKLLISRQFQFIPYLF
jgi:hypothetical protein